MNKQHNYCIILAGGIGRRLWPVSKQAKPKQFVDIFGVGRTLLQQTFDRFARIMDKNHIIVSTYKEYVPLVKEQLPELPDSCILAEPVQLSTAPAAAWASCHIANIDRDANIVVSPADQFIVNEANFAEQIAGGLDFVSKHDDFLVMGAVPTVPNTAYGYIQQGREHIDDTTSRVKSFSEKPTLEYARMFVESGEFLWNTGLMLWRTSTLLHLLKTNGVLMGNWLDTDWQGLTPPSTSWCLRNATMSTCAAATSDGPTLAAGQKSTTWRRKMPTAMPSSPMAMCCSPDAVTTSWTCPKTLAPSSADSTTTSWPSKATNW